MIEELAILVIGGIQIAAMVTDQDGVTLLPVIALIGALAGYHVRPKVDDVLRRVSPGKRP